MRKFILLGLCVLLPISATGQQAAQPADPNAAATKAALDTLAQQTSQVKLVSVNGINCPVTVSAERGGAGAMVQTRKGELSPSQSELHLHFLPGSRSSISEATITLHGSDGRPRAELASSGSSGYLTEQFHLNAASDHMLWNASVHPLKVVNVRWIDIAELTFADGTTWHKSENSYCHVQPNGFRRVTAEAQP